MGELSASELAVDEPVLWMIGDRRAARVTVGDHQWVRILDVPAALQARRYPAAGTIVLDVTDPLGFAEGRWRLTADASGSARVDRVECDAAEADSVVTLGVAELSAVYLGAVSLTTLVAAGRARATDAAAAARVLTWYEPARLSFWY